MLVKNTEPYEFLVRVFEGEVRGCHKRYLIKIVDNETGRLINESEGEAIPVELSEEMKSKIMELMREPSADQTQNANL